MSAQSCSVRLCAAGAPVPPRTNRTRTVCKQHIRRLGSVSGTTPIVARRNPSAPWRGRAITWETRACASIPLSVIRQHTLATKKVESEISRSSAAIPHMPNKAPTIQPAYIDAFGGCRAKHCNHDIDDQVRRVQERRSASKQHTSAERHWLCRCYIRIGD